MEEDVSKIVHLQIITGTKCQISIRQKNTLIFFLCWNILSPTVYVRK